MAVSPTGDQPPPYNPPTPTLAAEPTAVSPPAKKRSSAERFIIGTFLLILVIAALFVAAVTIQGMTYCLFKKKNSTFLQVILWVFYSGCCIWASTGVGCWAMLLRNLWGPKAIKRFPIDENIVALVVVGGVGMLIWGPFWCLWKGSVWIVEKCQGRFCGDAFDEEEDQQMPIELEEGRRLIPNRDLEGDDENRECLSSQVGLDIEREASKQRQ
jgi:hypothetical protein